MSLQFLMDKHAIEQVYIRYCEIIDAKSFDDLHEVFTEDTIGDYGLPGGVQNITIGIDPLVFSMHANLGVDSNCGATHHNVGNFRVEVNGDTAKAKVHYYAEHLGAHDFPGELYSMWGQYADDLVRTPVGWRVKNRLYKCYLSQGPVVTSPRQK
jgi:hypothetical protein